MTEFDPGLAETLVAKIISTSSHPEAHDGDRTEALSVPDAPAGTRADKIDDASKAAVRNVYLHARVKSLESMTYVLIGRVRCALFCARPIGDVVTKLL